MPKERISEGRDDEWISTPRGELEKLRQKQVKDDSATRTTILDPVLDVCGEIGYRQVTVETIYSHHGGSRSQFYHHFASKADCFATAYSRESERLLQSLPPFEAEALDSRRLQELLDRLATFVTTSPQRGRALFVEVHVAGN